jgi:RNA polymerase sigma-70 factor, ECF subfamily
VADDLAKLLADARAVWPTVDVAADVFTARVLAAVAAGATLDQVHASDLYLACGCAAGSRAALAMFEEAILSDVPTFLARFRRDAAFSDEVAQLLRHKLFVGPSPKIAEYAGRGPLRAWVRVAAVRTAVNLLGAGETVPGSDRDEADVLDGADVALLKARYRGPFRDALNASILALSTKERTLLRMHHVDGFTLDRLATVHRVHRATVARWLAAVRAQIVKGVRDRLVTELALSPAEVDSLATVIHSQLELSVGRLLGR